MGLGCTSHNHPATAAHLSSELNLHDGVRGGHGQTGPTVQPASGNARNSILNAKNADHSLFTSLIKIVAEQTCGSTTVQYAGSSLRSACSSPSIHSCLIATYKVTFSPLLCEGYLAIFRSVAWRNFQTLSFYHTASAHRSSRVSYATMPSSKGKPTDPQKREEARKGMFTLVE